jgi:hypothetical protein
MQTRGESLEVITVARFHANENVIAVTKISRELTHPFALDLLNVQFNKNRYYFMRLQDSTDCGRIMEFSLFSLL